MPPSALMKSWYVAGFTELLALATSFIESVIDGACAKALGNAKPGFEFIQ